MRRRKPKIKVILITFLFLLLCSTAYAYLETSLSIKGSVMGNYNNDGYVIDPGSNPYLEINNLTVNSWTEGNQYKYQFRFKLKNIGNITYDNFKVILTFSSNITGVNIWDYEYSFDQQILNVIKGSTNFTPNYEVEVNFIVSSNSNNLKINRIKLEVDTSSNPVPSDKVIVTFAKGNSWGNYTIQYNVTVKNESDKKINSWTLDIVLNNASYISGWSAKFETIGNTLRVKNETYNGEIAIGNSVTFGLQLNATSANYIPEEYSVSTR